MKIKEKDLRVYTIPSDPKDFKLADWQIEAIARAINPKDVRKYIDEHREEYIDWLKSEGLEDKKYFADKQNNDII